MITNPDPAVHVESESPFSLLPPALHPARPYLARAVSFARSLLLSGEKPGVRAWCWADSLRATAYRHADLARDQLAERPRPDVLVLLHFERGTDRQLRARVLVQCVGDAVELVGEATASLLGPWTVAP